MIKLLSQFFLNLILFSTIAFSQIVKLPSPEVSGGMPLMDALKNRQSTRDFSEKEISQQTLSDLLWAAFGVNRAESGKRTAPTAMDERAMEIYVVLKNGSFLFDAVEHSLIPISDKDIRSLAGSQPFVASAPLNLVFVADYSKMKSGNDSKSLYAAAHSGFIAQNVYLFCASEGLGAVIRAYFEEPALKEALKLTVDKDILLVQTVGYPKAK